MCDMSVSKTMRDSTVDDVKTRDGRVVGPTGHDIRILTKVPIDALLGVLFLHFHFSFASLFYTSPHTTKLHASGWPPGASRPLMATIMLHTTDGIPAVDLLHYASGVDSARCDALDLCRDS
jgi:hypothetical protein